MLCFSIYAFIIYVDQLLLLNLLRWWLLYLLHTLYCIVNTWDAATTFIHRYKHLWSLFFAIWCVRMMLFGCIDHNCICVHYDRYVFISYSDDKLHLLTNSIKNVCSWDNNMIFSWFWATKHENRSLQFCL